MLYFRPYINTWTSLTSSVQKFAWHAMWKSEHEPTWECSCNSSGEVTTSEDDLPINCTLSWEIFKTRTHLGSWKHCVLNVDFVNMLVIMSSVETLCFRYRNVACCFTPEKHFIAQKLMSRVSWDLIIEWWYSIMYLPQYLRRHK